MERSGLKRLKKIHLEAIRLRIEGYQLKQISEKMKVPMGTLRTWFYNSELFRTTFEEMQKEAIDSARNTLFNAAPDAAKKLIELQQDPKANNTQLQAAKDILDRIGLKQPEKQIVTNKNIDVDAKLLDNPETVDLLKQLFEKLE